MRVAVLFLQVLASATLQECLTELEKVLAGRSQIMPTDVYGEMASYSGLRINDLGDFINCNNLDNAEYALVQLAGTAYLSICGPQVCTKDDYTTILLGLFNSTQSLDLNFKELIEDKDHAIAHHSRIKIATTQKFGYLMDKQLVGDSDDLPFDIWFPQDYINDNYHTLASGTIVMLVICCILVLISTMATVYDLWQELYPIFKQSLRVNESEKISLQDMG